MLHPVVSAIVNYLHIVLWNWAGILLAIDGVVALGERYLGDYLEGKFQKKFHVSKELKWSFAVGVLIIAQAVAYDDLQNENQHLRNLDSGNNAKQVALEQDVKHLRDELIAKDRPIILQPASNEEIEQLKRRTAEIERNSPENSLSRKISRFAKQLQKKAAFEDQRRPKQPRTQEDMAAVRFSLNRSYSAWTSTYGPKCQSYVKELETESVDVSRLKDAC